jgi:hypothetical protein
MRCPDAEGVPTWAFWWVSRLTDSSEHGGDHVKSPVMLARRLLHLRNILVVTLVWFRDFYAWLWSPLFTF